MRHLHLQQHLNAVCRHIEEGRHAADSNTEGQVGLDREEVRIDRQRM